MSPGPCSISCSKTASTAVSFRLSIRSSPWLVCNSMEYQNGQPLLGRAPAGAHGPHLERISRRQVTVPKIFIDYCAIGGAHSVSGAQKVKDRISSNDPEKEKIDLQRRAALRKYAALAAGGSIVAVSAQEVLAAASDQGCKSSNKKANC